jgi:hypothetical protein
MSRYRVLPSLKHFGILTVAYVALAALSPQNSGVVLAQSSGVHTDALEIPHVVHLLGLGDLKPESPGTLTLNGRRMAFAVAGSRTEIPIRSIRAFSISHDNVALVGGAKGAIAGMAPYGVGQVITVIRPNVDTFTLVYTDENKAVHGSILLLPKGKGDDVTQALALDGVLPRDYPETGLIGPAETMNKGAVKKEIEKAHGLPSVRIALLTESVDGIPAEFPVGVYEELVTGLTKSGMFQKVWRQGDTRTDSDVLTLHVNIQQLKKGSARARGLVPFAGPTVIKVDVRLTDPANRVLLQKDMTAAKRLRGENMVVTKNLTKSIKKELSKLPSLQAPESTSTMD